MGNNRVSSTQTPKIHASKMIGNCPWFAMKPILFEAWAGKKCIFFLPIAFGAWAIATHLCCMSVAGLKVACGK